MLKTFKRMILLRPFCPALDITDFSRIFHQYCAVPSREIRELEWDPLSLRKHSVAFSHSAQDILKVSWNFLHLPSNVFFFCCYFSKLGVYIQYSYHILIETNLIKLKRLVPSNRPAHKTFIRHLINVNVTSWHCTDIDTMLHQHHLSAGTLY